MNLNHRLVLDILLFSLPALVGADDESKWARSSVAETLADSLLGSLGNGSSALGAFLGDHDTVIFQNGLVRLSSTGMNGTAVICPSLSVIFARGTLEPGNVGILTGPPFFAALAAIMNGTNQLAIQGVPYPADIQGFLTGGSPAGATTMANLIAHTLAACPSTRLLVSGYSQGAQLVHLAAASLPTNITSKIASVVMFGDPMNGTAISGVDSRRVLTVCHAGDEICQGGEQVVKAHLNYSADATGAAGFVYGTAGAELGITSMRLKRVVMGGLGF